MTSLAALSKSFLDEELHSFKKEFPEKKKSKILTYLALSL